MRPMIVFTVPPTELRYPTISLFRREKTIRHKCKSTCDHNPYRSERLSSFWLSRRSCRLLFLRIVIQDSMNINICTRNCSLIHFVNSSVRSSHFDSPLARRLVQTHL